MLQFIFKGKRAVCLSTIIQQIFYILKDMELQTREKKNEGENGNILDKNAMQDNDKN